jgi:hypothetical protein
MDEGAIVREAAAVIPLSVIVVGSSAERPEMDLDLCAIAKESILDRPRLQIGRIEEGIGRSPARPCGRRQTAPATAEVQGACHLGCENVPASDH